MPSRAVARGFAVHQPFTVARAFARRLRLKSKEQWRRYVRMRGLPPGIPIRPGQAYRGTWQGWADFLGYQVKEAAPLPAGIWAFRKVRSLVQAKHFRGSAEFLRWVRKQAPEGVPRAPEQVYGHTWRGWRDFLGESYHSVKGAERWPYAKAKAHVRKLGLTSRAEFIAWTHSKDRPPGFPRFPYGVYGRDWESWEAFLGPSYQIRRGGRPQRHRTLLGFEKVRAAARRAGIENSSQYIAWVGKQPLEAGYPRYLAQTYPQKWSGWADFLGKNYRARIRGRRTKLRAVKAQVLKARISSKREYLKQARLPGSGWPVDPEQYFDGVGWRGWGYFLGKGGRSASGRRVGRPTQAPRVARIAALKALGAERGAGTSKRKERKRTVKARRQAR